jgi:hypothetical protein
MVWGLMWTPDRWGREDWDYFVHHYEAMRRSVLEYRQVPWWNPWNCGGMPLAANPQIGLVSISFLCVLLFGTTLGLKLATLIHLMIAAEGARWLSGLWLRDPVARVVAGFIYAGNGSVALYCAAGHLGIQLIAWIPWAIGLTFVLERGAIYGVALGVVLAMTVLTSMQYFAVYLFMIIAVLIISRLVAPTAFHGVLLHERCGQPWSMGQGSERDGTQRMIRNLMWASAVFLSLAGFRMVIASELVLDFPRGRFSQIRQSESVMDLVGSLIVPGQRIDRRAPGSVTPGWHEYGCYVGVLPCLLFFASLKRGWRWWHVLALLCLWLAIGNARWFHLSRWVADMPVLGMMRVASRWRVIGVLGIALAVAQIVTDWHSSPRPWLRRVALFLSAAITLDLLIQSHLNYRDAFVLQPELIDRSDQPRTFVQQHNQSPPALASSAIQKTLNANYGVIYGYEPLIGQDDNPRSSLLWVGHPEYRGEYSSDSGPVRLLHWSPNSIELEAAPGAEVVVNQNPGSYWLAKGCRVFPDLRAVDRHQTFKVTAESDGKVDLTVLPHTWLSGLAATMAGVVGLTALAFTTRRERRIESPPN